jgi:hypothetical protein
VVPFQKCVHLRRPVSKMAAITKNRNFFKWPKLYKHNDELFNIYYRIFYELPDTILEEDHPRITSAKFGWDWLSSFRGEDFFLISSPLFSNLHNRWNYWANLNQTLLKWSLGGPLSKLCPSAPSCIQDGRYY